jgi:hypothetical protein
MLTLIVGGSEHAIPVHAKVIILDFPLESVQVTRMTGQGKKAGHGFFFNFINSDFLSFYLILMN